MRKLILILCVLLFSNLCFSQQIIGRKPILGSQINWSHPLAEGILGLWLINEGSGLQIFDSINDQVFVGTFFSLDEDDWVPGRDGWALDFDGTDDDVLVGLHSDLLGTSATQHFTVIVWARTDAFPAVRAGIISSYDSATGSNGWDIRLEATATPSAGAVFSIGGTSNAGVFAQADFDATEWIHYTGRFDGDNVEIFVNGVLGSTVDTSTINGTDRNIYIGAGFFDNTPGDAAGAGRPFDGTISYVIIYNRALTTQEIYEHYVNSYAMYEGILE